MNYKPAVSWGICVGGTASQRASYFASWGILDSLPTPTVSKKKSGLFSMVMKMFF